MQYFRKKTFLTQPFLAFQVDFSLANAFILHFRGWSKGLLKLWSCHLHIYWDIWGQTCKKNKVGYQVLTGFVVTWPTQRNPFLQKCWSTVMNQQTSGQYFKSYPTKTEKFYIFSKGNRSQTNFHGWRKAVLLSRSNFNRERPLLKILGIFKIKN